MLVANESATTTNVVFSMYIIMLFLYYVMHWIIISLINGLGVCEWRYFAHSLKIYLLYIWGSIGGKGKRKGEKGLGL